MHCMRSCLRFPIKENQNPNYFRISSHMRLMWKWLLSQGPSHPPQNSAGVILFVLSFGPHSIQWIALTRAIDILHDLVEEGNDEGHSHCCIGQPIMLEKSTRNERSLKNRSSFCIFCTLGLIKPGAKPHHGSPFLFGHVTWLIQRNIWSTERILIRLSFRSSAVKFQRAKK